MVVQWFAKLSNCIRENYNLIVEIRILIKNVFKKVRGTGPYNEGGKEVFKLFVV